MTASTFIKKQINTTCHQGRIVILLFFFIGSLVTKAHAQNEIQKKPTTKDTSGVVDIDDLLAKLFKTTRTAAQDQSPGIAFLPAIGYNPSFGFILGAKLSAVERFGDAATTKSSVFGLEAIFTSKGINILQFRHNYFTKGDKWNWQGKWQVSKYGIVDYGIGTGHGTPSTGIDLEQEPTQNADSSYPINYGYTVLLERGFYNIGHHFFAGGGVSFNIFNKINDIKQSDSFNTPHQNYSMKYGYDPKKYSSNGFLICGQYNTRENPVRSYGGIYADVSLIFNQEWMGSSRNAMQISWDFRKYWSLSKRRPETVLAIWNLATFTLAGTTPYLALPNTGADVNNRSGRGYTIGRFKGPNYEDLEAEFRFPITRNKLFSGVCFGSLQSASDGMNEKIFMSFEPAVGAGLRILFQKETRTTLCLDYAVGKYGSNGFFCGLNEAF
jgi:hypothetical protein